MDNAKVADRIRARCSELGIAPTTMLAETIKRKGLIYDMEKRNWTPSAALIERVADELNCSIDYLMCRTDNPHIKRTKKM